MLKPVYFTFVETVLEFFFFFRKLHSFYPSSRGPFSKYTRRKLCVYQYRYEKISFGTQGTHFVKSRAHSPTSKIISMIALTRATLMKADSVVSLHANRLFSVPHILMQKRPLFRNTAIEKEWLTASPLKPRTCFQRTLCKPHNMFKICQLFKFRKKIR